MGEAQRERSQKNTSLKAKKETCQRLTTTPNNFKKSKISISNNKIPIGEFPHDSIRERLGATKGGRLGGCNETRRVAEDEVRISQVPRGSAGFRDPPPYHRFVVCLGFQRYDSPFEMVVKNCKRGCRWVDFLGSFFLENGSDSASSYTISICKFMRLAAI